MADTQEYIESLGLITLPLWPLSPTPDSEATNGIRIVCSCSKGEKCKKPGKHPKPHAKASTNYGIRCNAESGVFVIDLDNKAGDQNGITNFGTLLAGRPLPNTFTVETPSGGFHFYFKHPKDRKIVTKVNHPAIGVDTRGDGGYAVGPGSFHVAGEIYQIVNDAPFADAPEWLLDLVTEKATPLPENHERGLTPIDITHPFWNLYTDKFLQECQQGMPAIEGEGGDDRLFKLVKFGVRDLCLPDQFVYETVWQHFNPRCEPPWDGQEFDERMTHKLADARYRGRSDTMTVIPEGFYDNLVALAVPQEIRPEKPSKEITRRTKDLAATHQYTYELYEPLPEATKPAKTTLSKASWLLRCSPVWSGVFQFDEFRQDLIAVNPPFPLDCEKPRSGLPESDVVAMQLWFEHYGMAVTRENLRALVIQVAKSNRFHPVLEYLNGITPLRDDALLDTLATELFGCTEPQESLYLKLFLIGAARRILTPGCDMHTMLVLCGDQGIGKSTVVRTLFGTEYTRDQISDLSNKDSSQDLLGFWCVELAELDKILRTENSTVKAFLTRSADRFRPPYERGTQEFLRQCVFVGTSNTFDFLRDETGERRYWPVTVNANIDIPKVAELRDWIWAAVLWEVEQGTPHWLTAEQNRQLEPLKEKYAQEDPWLEYVAAYLVGKTEVITRDVFKTAIMNDDADAARHFDRKAQREISKILSKLGWEAITKRLGGSPTRTWSKKQ